MIDVITHEAPVWRDKSNFIISGELDPPDKSYHWEQIWARQIEDFKFEICCIPFFLYDLALGDHVITDTTYVIKEVVKMSGHYTFRLWFERSDLRGLVINKIGEMGYLMELHSATSNLLAIDAASEKQAKMLANTLMSWEQQGVLTYETGRT